MIFSVLQPAPTSMAAMSIDVPGEPLKNDPCWTNEGTKGHVLARHTRHIFLCTNFGMLFERWFFRTTMPFATRQARGWLTAELLFVLPTTFILSRGYHDHISEFRTAIGDMEIRPSPRQARGGRVKMIHRTTIIILLDTTTISIIRFLSVLSTKPNITLLTSQLLDRCEGISISRSVQKTCKLVRNECGAAMRRTMMWCWHERTELGPLATNKKAKNQNVSKVLRPSSIEPG